MTEIVTILGALGGLITMGIMFYREVRKRADLEVQITTLLSVVDANKLYNEEVKELEDALHRSHIYIDELEQKVVDYLEPSDLADAINGVLWRSAEDDNNSDDN